MVYSVFKVITVSSFLAITRDKNAFSSYPVRIETLFIVFSAFILSLAKAVNRFFTVLSASARSLF
jgi:hypothetical protein